MVLLFTVYLLNLTLWPGSGQIYHWRKTLHVCLMFSLCNHLMLLSILCMFYMVLFLSHLDCKLSLLGSALWQKFWLCLMYSRDDLGLTFRVLATGRSDAVWRACDETLWFGSWKDFVVSPCRVRNSDSFITIFFLGAVKCCSVVTAKRTENNAV